MPFRKLAHCDGRLQDPRATRDQAASWIESLDAILDSVSVRKVE